MSALLFSDRLYFRIKVDDNGHKGYPFGVPQTTTKTFSVHVMPENDPPVLQFFEEIAQAVEGEWRHITGTKVDDIDLIDQTLYRTGRLYRDGTTPETAAPSCLAIKAHHPTSPSGAYYIDPRADTLVSADDDGGAEGHEGVARSGTFQGYCDQESDGGGWLLYGVQSPIYRSGDATPQEFFSGAMSGTPPPRGEMRSYRTSRTWTHGSIGDVMPWGPLQLKTNIQLATITLHDRLAANGKATDRLSKTQNAPTHGVFRLPGAHVLLATNADSLARRPLDIEHKCSLDDS